MTKEPLPAYCFYKVFDPEPPKTMCFDRHYLLYAAKGALRLSAHDRNWILPPTRAALIPAGCTINIDITHTVTCCSVLFDTDFFKLQTDQCQVIALSQVAQNMIEHTQQWGPDTKKLDDHAINFFKALAGICVELAKFPSNVWLPKGQSQCMQQALKFTYDNLSKSISFIEVAAHCNISQRSLSRRFEQETQLTWRQMLRRMRMIRAIELLSNTNDQIISVALQVGYESLSAFNRAFLDFTEDTPTKFHKLHSLKPSIS